MLGYEDVGTVHREIEKVIDVKGKFKLFLIPRGHLKSSYITMGYAIQSLIRDPNKRILIVNATWDNARKFLKEIKGKILSDEFKDVFGDWGTEQWNMDECTIAARTKTLKEASISTAGLEKSITGQHYETIIMDDLVNKENVTTPDQIRKVIEYYESLLPILEPNGELIVVGTVWHKLDLYNHIQTKLKKQFVVFKRGVEVDGKFIFPEKFNKDVLATIKANMRPSLFASQYYNEPISEENQIFKHEQFRYYDSLPANITVVNTTVDIARSERHDSDETAIVTVGWTPKSDCYLIDVQHGMWGTQEKIEKMHGVNKTFKPQILAIEKDANQKYFLDTISMSENMGFERLPFTEISSGNKNKEDRIMNLEPLFRAGKVYFPKGPDWVQDLELQLLSFTPQGTHGKDDIIDALASHLKIYTPEEIESKTLTYVDKHHDKEKDLQFWANAILWDTEDYNKKKNQSEEDLWLAEIEGWE